MYFLMAAISLGFLGSFHCIGMCGPIAMALPLGRESKIKRIAGVLFYNAGRIFTYGLLGLLFGAVGETFIIGGYQQMLSITLGVLILVGIMIPARWTSSLSLTKAVAPVVMKLKSRLAALFRQKSMSALFSIGLLNGLLPCGLIYLAVAGAIATGDSFNGGLFMMFFGSGTLPAMLFVSFASGWVNVQWRSSMKKVVPVFVVIMACGLILRGMNLGIPYVSPELSKTDCTQHKCCHKNQESWK